jgi:oligopeptide/dipeptide ABC transporter ATP-binding protein
VKLLEIRDLKTHLRTEHGVARAVDGVDLEVEAGEALGIVGESGSGKTLLALSILGLLPEGGREIQPGSSIRFQGEELVGMALRGLRGLRGGGIAMVFQEPMTSLNPVFSVGSQIAESIRHRWGLGRRKAWREAVDLLREVGIADPATRSRDYPHQMSGGMRQRVMIAMALAGGPDLLIADEPTTALDPTVQGEILRLLAGLRSYKGMGMILISHDLGVVAEVCQRILVMYAGKVVESGPALEILRNPSHPYTRGLLESRARADPGGRLLSFIPGEVPEATRWPEGCRFHTRCPEAWEKCRLEPPVLPHPPDREMDGGRWARCWSLEEEGSAP